VFPQIKGLGQSSASSYYGLDGVAAAADYLRDPVLGERLIAASTEARTHLSRTPPLNIVVLMGSVVDTLKLVSCMTLFHHVSRMPAGADAGPRFTAMAEHAGAILAAAAAQGYDTCRYTVEQIRRTTN
jgi:uncharacterized protein (DUF1810 family)